jgi:AraC-like DNA-binding protein
MPIYMDVHKVPGVKARDVAEAHHKDLFHQDEYGCKCLTYWIDEQRENIFCLVEAPEKEAVEELHRKAHGLIPNRIIEVNKTLVESFLGRIYDPEEASVTDEGLKVFSDSSFRILLVTRTTDPVLLQHKMGIEKTNALLSDHNTTIRRNIAQYGGREVEHESNGFIVSFTSATKAVTCALAIQKEMQHAADIGFKTSINAGDPVEKSNNIFGDAIRLATNLCMIANNRKIFLASVVKDIVSKDLLQDDIKHFFSLSPGDESLLLLLFTKLEENWQDADFDISKYCYAVAMSTSQLYRKTISLTGLSPNTLLKQYRLEKAKELMKRQRYSIAQITFETGFTSASYFTKCFKRQYSLLPMAYLDLLH